MWRSFKEGQSDVRELKKKRYQRVGGGERAGESCVKARDLEIVSKRGSHARFPKKHEQGTSQDSLHPGPSSGVEEAVYSFYLSLLTSAHRTMSSNFLFFTLVESHSPSVYGVACVCVCVCVCFYECETEKLVGWRRGEGGGGGGDL